MIGTASSSYRYDRPVENDRDLSWYATFVLLAACLVVLAATGLVG